MIAKSQLWKYLPICYNSVLFCLTANMRSVSEEPVPLHEEFIYCCGAATHVLKCGPWKDLSNDESKNLPRLLFMIIPGKCLFVHFKFGNVMNWNRHTQFQYQKCSGINLAHKWLKISGIAMVKFLFWIWISTVICNLNKKLPVLLFKIKLSKWNVSFILWWLLQQHIF